MHASESPHLIQHRFDAFKMPRRNNPPKALARRRILTKIALESLPSLDFELLDVDRGVE